MRSQEPLKLERNSQETGEILDASGTLPPSPLKYEEPVEKNALSKHWLLIGYTEKSSNRITENSCKKLFVPGESNSKGMVGREAVARLQRVKEW